MNLNRAELRKIIYDFNSISNRLLQADFQDYSSVLSKFIAFIRGNELINDFIVDCGECEQDLEKEFQEIRASYGRCIFSVGDSDEEEVRDVYAILSHIVDNKLEIHYQIAMGYSHDTKYQSKIKGFNDRVVMILIRHIERYLTKIGIDMGIDEKTTYEITVHQGQVNIASGNSTINATNNFGFDATRFAELIRAVKDNSAELVGEDKEMLDSNLEVLQEEMKSSAPRKGFIKTALAWLKGLKCSVELAAAVAALVEFVSGVL